MTMDNFGKHYTLNSEAPLYVGGEDLPCPGLLHRVMVRACLGGASVALPLECWCLGLWT